MSVKGENPGGSRDRTHESADFMEVKEGHLVVKTSAAGDVVAVYAPTVWRHAELVEKDA